MDRYYSTFDVAKICHVSPASVIRWIREGKLRASVTAGGHNRVHETDLIQLLQSLRLPIPSQIHQQDHYRVLVVDDEPGIQDMISSVVKNFFSNVTIEVADNGFSAGWKTQQFQPDLILMDIRMPGMNGIEVCRYIRSFPGLSETRIFILTGLLGKEIEQKAREAGANEFLHKPFELDELRDKIFKLLEGNDRLKANVAANTPPVPGPASPSSEKGVA